MFIMFKSQFRHGILDWRYIFLLPTILFLQSTKKPVEPSSSFMVYTFISTVPTLLSYRLNLKFVWFALSQVAFVCLLQVSGFFEIKVSIGAFLVITNLLSLLILRAVPSVYTRCFTFVEFTIIVQPLIYYLFQIFLFNWANLSRQQNIQSETSLVCLTCYSSLLIALILSKFLKTRLLKTFCFLILLPVFLYVFLYHVLPIEPLSWLLNYVFGIQRRINLFILWSTVLLFTCIFAFCHTYHSNGVTTTVTRKMFHFAISLVYLLGIRYDVQLLEFSSKLILFVFLYVEIVRLNDITVLSKVINQIFEHFRDEKDSGILTLTHIYLLIGCSAPLWLSSSLTEQSRLLLASGVITVGIGDSFASLGGFYFGFHKWPNSKKSYEGTLCSFISQFIALVLLHIHFSMPSLIISDLLKFVLVSFVSSLAETFTSHVDNLILPLVQFLLVLLIF